MNSSNPVSNNKEKTFLKETFSIVGSLLSFIVTVLTIIQILLNLYSNSFKRQEEIENSSYSITINIYN
jgi:hypothetical protein